MVFSKQFWKMRKRGETRIRPHPSAWLASIHHCTGTPCFTVNWWTKAASVTLFDGFA